MSSKKAKAKKDTDAPTPMMAQFLGIKEAYPDMLLFYRMGDFYEMFFEDAKNAAEALDIALTKRGTHKGEPIPMCGVPVHSHETYLQRLIRKGFKVAICEQMEDPAEAKKRGYKAVVKRDVVRIITPGTITEDSLLDSRRHNYLTALASVRNDLAFAWLDMSTGAFFVQTVATGADKDTRAGRVAAAFARLAPGEILVPDALTYEPDFFDVFAEWRGALTPLPDARFSSQSAEKQLLEAYNMASLDAFGSFTRAEKTAAGLLLDYVKTTQKGQMPRLDALKKEASDAAMHIDAATRRNLELTDPLMAEQTGKGTTLLSVMDETVTGPGGRLLRQWVTAPLTEASRIDARLDQVSFFVNETMKREMLRDLLKRCPDMERALSRLSLGRAGPRDLASVGHALSLVPDIRSLLDDPAVGLPQDLSETLAALGDHTTLVDRLTRALAEELPLLARDGGFIAEGYASELDEQRGLRDKSRTLIRDLQLKYQEETGINSLKIKHNNVLGYFVEVPPRHADKLMDPESGFIHRQTLANNVRFTTVILSEFENNIRGAAEKSLALELALFADLSEDVMQAAETIGLSAQALARLDVLAGLGELAVIRSYCRPEIEDTRRFEIEEGRHPVVEKALEAENAPPFVANNCSLSGEGADDGRLWLLTGPNMAGKSTFLRQNALIAIMAQMGSFVPAKKAVIGCVDRLFSRVGAADDLARGRSTFMVEMVETAAILNQATDRSLVILDEIGRGTATFDGLSIAWAVVEHLHDISCCRALFATHYHELTSLSSRLAEMALYTMRIKEWQGDVVFLHEVAAGAADRSYGIHVGQMAGLPPSVIDRAETVLKTLQDGEQGSAVNQLAEDLPLFAALTPAPHQTAAAEPPKALEALKTLSPDDLSPREALEELYRLKGLAEE